MLKTLDNNKKTISLLCLYLLCWTIIPTLSTSSYPLDVIEGIVWGQELQWGYYKHPPLPSWLLYVFHATFGEIGPYLLSQISLLAAIYYVYLLAKQLVSSDKAFVASLLLLASFYYTWPTLEYNHNIALLPIWASITYFYYRAIQTNHLKKWLIFGALCGLGLLTKYTTMLLLLCLLAYTFTPNYRYIWKQKPVWLAILCANIVFIPHVYWLYTNDWLPFQYALGRSGSNGFWDGRLTSLKFIGAQLINHLPLILILAFTTLMLRMRKCELNKNNRFIIFIALSPAVVVSGISLLFNIKLLDMWGMPMWNYSSLLVIILIPDERWLKAKKYIMKGLFVWLSIVTILMTLYVNYGATWLKENTRIDWPQKTISQKTQAKWNELSACPLKVITGHYWLAGLAIVGDNYAQENRPSLLLIGAPKLSPWIKQDDVKKSGSLLIWQDGAPSSPYLENLPAHEFVITGGSWQLSWPKQPKTKPLSVKWRAYVPNHCLP